VPTASTSITFAGDGSASDSTVSSAPILDLTVGSTVSSAVGLDLIVMRSDLGIGGPVAAASASVRPADGDPPLSSSSKASSELLELGAVWKSARASQHDQFALPELAPSPALVGFGPAFQDVPGDCSSSADALGERLRYSLPVMSESEAPIYSSESKSVLRYSLKHKVGKLDEHLLAEAFNASMDPSMSLYRVAAKPLLAPARDGVVSTPAPSPKRRDPSSIRNGWVSSLSSVQPVLGCPHLLPFSEVGESSREGGFEEIGSPPGAAIDLSFCFQTLGVSHEGNVKGFLDFMAQIDSEQR